jgi:hypothetical protein
MRPDKIKEIINERTNINIDTPTRRRDHVYARAIYFKLCRDLTPLRLHEIAKTVDKNHATVLHGLNNIFPLLKQYDDPLYNIYVELMEHKLMPLREKYDLLKHKYKELSKYTLDQKYNNLLNIIKKVPENELEHAELRFGTITDMLINKNKK